MAGSDSSDPATPEPSPEDQRHELQGVLGEYHGLLTTIVVLLRGPGPDADMTVLLADIQNAFPGVSVSFGQIQGELNSGRQDQRLEAAALTAEQFSPKKRGFRYNCTRFYNASTNITAMPTNPDSIQAVKHAMRGVKWGNIIIGSLAKELGKFKGAEVIKEFGEVVVTTLEQIADALEAKAAEEHK
jgi:hypothetical protein